MLTAAHCVANASSTLSLTASDYTGGGGGGGRLLRRPCSVHEQPS